ncbi:dihydrodipicolinate synthase family protein [Sinomonas sp. ASV322]|uniref:dihydrodipicolinate synthase family protein n=1 Tax=Sinomonas sp. ASV322 TaxID=3041920 RepID=UPI0027DC5F2C|nr:dihydrodipicolinate synthase family protein [Sinomonas sp. ASV322]MDQ4504526.1 dihydrodipicolinate synthase family protein [Sinomonas sp. ASV322]
MFDGLCAFPLTPLADDTVDDDALAALVSRLAAAGVGSLGVLGSTGVYPYLSRDERRAALTAAVDAAGGVPVVAGVGALRTSDVLLYADDAQAAGASALLVAPVSYHQLRDDEVFGLYADLSAAASVPIVIYDNPGTTGFAFTERLYARLAELPHVAAVKNPPTPAGTAAARAAELRAVLPNGFSIGISGDWAAAEALADGFDAWYSVLAGVFPLAAMAIVDAAKAGDRDAALALSARLDPLWNLFRTHGSLRVVAAIAELLGLAERPWLPRPLLGLDAGARADVEAALLATGLQP